MATQKVLFISNCIGDNGRFHAKGTIETFDDEKKSDVPLLANLKAAARIVPPTKENLERCLAELKKKKETVPPELAAELAGPSAPAK